MPRLTSYGQAGIGTELAGGTHLLFDPFVSPNGLAKAVDVEAIPADHILITVGRAPFA